MSGQGGSALSVGANIATASRPRPCAGNIWPPLTAGGGMHITGSHLGPQFLLCGQTRDCNSQLKGIGKVMFRKTAKARIG